MSSSRTTKTEARPIGDREVIARLRHVGLDADIDPVAAEDGLDVEIEDLTALVERSFERMTRLAPEDHRPQFI